MLETKRFLKTLVEKLNVNKTRSVMKQEKGRNKMNSLKHF